MGLTLLLGSKAGVDGEGGSGPNPDPPPQTIRTRTGFPGVNREELAQNPRGDLKDLTEELQASLQTPHKA